MKNTENPRYETHLSHNSQQTQELARRLGKRLRASDLVLLHGELGAGKTTFVQGIAQSLQVRGDLVSPTFVLILEHEGAIPLLHLDAYRLENLDDEALQDAGVFDFLSRADAIKIIEWPSRIAEVLPLPRFEIFLRHGEKTEDRVLEIIEREL